MRSYFNTSDYAIMGGKAVASVSGNRGAQNGIDAISLGSNAYGYMQACSRLQSLERQYSYSYGYGSCDIQREMDYYRGQRNKHFALAIFDLISLLCRNSRRY